MSAAPITYVRDDRFTGTDTPVALGSREHFFHFLLGYLLPLVHLHSRRAADHVQVLDCGPLMTPILVQTLERLAWSATVVSPANAGNREFLPAWDHHWDDRDDVSAAVRHVKQAWQTFECAGRNCARSSNLLIQRSAPHPYYATDSAEISGYGTQRRGITNGAEIAEWLTAHGIEHALYEPGAHALGCQIRAFSHARRVVGMRGAEWANAVWCTPGVRVRVLDPDPPAPLLGGLLARLGIRHEFVAVAHRQAEDDPVAVARFLTAP